MLRGSNMLQHEISIPVRDLDAAGKPFRFPLRSVWLRGALEGTDVRAAENDGQLDLRLSRSGTDVVVRGALEASVVVPCARCLEPVRVAIQEPLSVLAVPSAPAGAPGSGDDDDGGAEQADLIPYDGETLVLDDLVRDAILLGIPMIPLCSEACPGIRPQPPEESATPAPGIDPRLRPLLRLKKSTP
jgi:uncharacterized protein